MSDKECFDVTGVNSEGDHAFTYDALVGVKNEPMYSGALSFMRRPYSKNLQEADIAVCGIPFDLATSSRPGARLGPQAIRRASALQAWSKPYPSGDNIFDTVKVIDYGDVVFDPGSPQTIVDKLMGYTKNILKTNTHMLSLGGDHFVTYPILKEHSRHFGKGISLIHFDAHSDTWEEPTMRLDHGTMFYHAAKEGIVNPEKSVQIGIRTYNKHTHGFHIIDAEKVNESLAEEVFQDIVKRVGDNPCYITFDIDCLDPAFAPGTGTPVSGGLDSAKALAIVKRLANHSRAGKLNILGGDVVEVSPSYDVSDITAIAASAIANEILRAIIYKVEISKYKKLNEQT